MTAQPDPHAWQPIRYRVWGRRQWPWRTRCGVAGCDLPPSEHPKDE